MHWGIDSPSFLLSKPPFLGKPPPPPIYCFFMTHPPKKLIYQKNPKMFFILNPILPFYLLKVTRFLIKIKYFRIYFSYKNCTSLPLEKGHSLFPSDTPLKMRSCQAPTFEHLAEVQPHHQKEQGGGAHYIIVGKGVRVPPF